MKKIVNHSNVPIIMKTDEQLQLQSHIQMYKYQIHPKTYKSAGSTQEDKLLHVIRILLFTHAEYLLALFPHFHGCH